MDRVATDTLGLRLVIHDGVAMLPERRTRLDFEEPVVPGRLAALRDVLVPTGILATLATTAMMAYAPKAAHAESSGALTPVRVEGIFSTLGVGMQKNGFDTDLTKHGMDAHIDSKAGRSLSDGVKSTELDAAYVATSKLRIVGLGNDEPIATYKDSVDSEIKATITASQTPGVIVLVEKYARVSDAVKKNLIDLQLALQYSTRATNPVRVVILPMNDFANTSLATEFTADGTELTDKGYGLMAEHVASELQKIIDTNLPSAQVAASVEVTRPAPVAANIAASTPDAASSDPGFDFTPSTSRKRTVAVVVNIPTATPAPIASSMDSTLQTTDQSAASSTQSITKPDSQTGVVEVPTASDATAGTDAAPGVSFVTSRRHTVTQVVVVPVAAAAASPEQAAPSAAAARTTTTAPVAVAQAPTPVAIPEVAPVIVAPVAPAPVKVQSPASPEVSTMPVDQKYAQIYQIISDSVHVNAGVLKRDASLAAFNILLTLDKHPDPTSWVGGHPELFVQMAPPTADYPWIQNTCDSGLFDRPAGILESMLYSVLYEYHLQMPQNASFRNTAPVERDKAERKGTHLTHWHGVQSDVVSGVLAPSVQGNSSSGPIYNMASPHYNLAFTESMDLLLGLAEAPGGGYLTENILTSDRTDIANVNAAARAAGRSQAVDVYVALHSDHHHLNSRSNIGVAESKDGIEGGPTADSACDHTYDQMSPEMFAAVMTKRATYTTDGTAQVVPPAALPDTPVAPPQVVTPAPAVPAPVAPVVVHPSPSPILVPAEGNNPISNSTDGSTAIDFSTPVHSSTQVTIVDVPAANTPVDTNDGLSSNPATTNTDGIPFGQNSRRKVTPVVVTVVGADPSVSAGNQSGTGAGNGAGAGSANGAGNGAVNNSGSNNSSTNTTNPVPIQNGGQTNGNGGTGTGTGTGTGDANPAQAGPEDKTPTQSNNGNTDTNSGADQNNGSNDNSGTDFGAAKKNPVAATPVAPIDTTPKSADGTPKTADPTPAQNNPAPDQKNPTPAKNDPAPGTPNADTNPNQVKAGKHFVLAPNATELVSSNSRLNQQQKDCVLKLLPLINDILVKHPDEHFNPRLLTSQGTTETTYCTSDLFTLANNVGGNKASGGRKGPVIQRKDDEKGLSTFIVFDTPEDSFQYMVDSYNKLPFYADTTRDYLDDSCAAMGLVFKTENDGVKCYIVGRESQYATIAAPGDNTKYPIYDKLQVARMELLDMKDVWPLIDNK